MKKEGKFCVFRSQKLKSVQNANFRQNHNNKKFGPALGDDEKVVFKDLVIPGTPTQTHKGKMFSEIFKEVTEGKTVRKNAVIGFEAILTFSHGAVPPERLREWAEASVGFLIEVYGKHNLFDIKLHLSERTPHIHAICGAMVEDKDGQMKLSGNNIIKGPMHLSKLQDRYAELMAEFGLERGNEKPRGKKPKHKKVRDWYAKGNEVAARMQTYETLYGTEQEWSLSEKLKFNETMHKVIKSDEVALYDLKSNEEIEK